MKVLLIGGSRFVGLEILLQLLEKNYEITVFNRGNNNKNLPSNVQILEGDRKKKEDIEKLLKNKSFDIVIDTCGYIPLDVEIMIELFRGKIKQYIFCSTVSVYDFERIYTMPIKEDFTLNYALVESDNPYVNYGSNKTLCEKALLSNGSFPVTIFRPVYIYGPHNYIYREAYFFDRIENDRPILIPDGGFNVAHYVHVEDLGRAFISSIGNKNTYNQIYNLASEEVVTIYSFSKLCGKALSKEVEIKTYNSDLLEKIFAEAELSNPRSPIFPFSTTSSIMFDISKAKNELGWKQKYNMEMGLKNAYEWYKNSNRKAPDYSNDDKILENIKVQI